MCKLQENRWLHKIFMSSSFALKLKAIVIKLHEIDFFSSSRRCSDWLDSADEEYVHEKEETSMMPSFLDWCYHVIRLINVRRGKLLQFTSHFPPSIDKSCMNEPACLTCTMSPCSCPEAVKVKWQRKGIRFHCGVGTCIEYVRPMSP